MNKLMDVKIISVEAKSDERGDLFFLEHDQLLPFNFQRVFFITGNKNYLRGNHAHKKCDQFMLCISGEIIIELSDNVESKKIKLNDPKKGIFVPSMIWSRQLYVTEKSCLVVFCSDKYDEKDYIRDYDEFIQKRRNDSDEGQLK